MYTLEATETFLSIKETKIGKLVLQYFEGDTITVNALDGYYKELIENNKLKLKGWESGEESLLYPERRKVL